MSGSKVCWKRFGLWEVKWKPPRLTTPKESSNQLVRFIASSDLTLQPISQSLPLHKQGTRNSKPTWAISANLPLKTTTRRLGDSSHKVLKRWRTRRGNTLGNSVTGFDASLVQNSSGLEKKMERMLPRSSLWTLQVRNSNIHLWQADWRPLCLSLIDLTDWDTVRQSAINTVKGETAMLKLLTQYWLSDSLCFHSSFLIRRTTTSTFIESSRRAFFPL